MTTYKQKLEDMFQTCVASARDSFMKDGALHTHWVIEDKHGTRILMAFAPDISKEAMLEQMRKVAKDKDIVRYVVETEAWMGVGDGLPPSQRADRMEAILVMGADRQDNSLLVTIEIERKGDKHYLGETIRGDGCVVGGSFQIFEEGENQ